MRSEYVYIKLSGLTLLICTDNLNALVFNKYLAIEWLRKKSESNNIFPLEHFHSAT